MNVLLMNMSPFAILIHQDFDVHICPYSSNHTKKNEKETGKTNHVEKKGQEQ